jgi:hypothetical protein
MPCLAREGSPAAALPPRASSRQRIVDYARRICMAPTCRRSHAHQHSHNRQEEPPARCRHRPRPDDAGQAHRHDGTRRTGVKPNVSTTSVNSDPHAGPNWERPCLSDRCKRCWRTGPSSRARAGTRGAGGCPTSTATSCSPSTPRAEPARSWSSMGSRRGSGGCPTARCSSSRCATTASCAGRSRLAWRCTPT